METELTKRIKLLTHSYKPQMSTGEVGRTIRFADEVWTPTGSRTMFLIVKRGVCRLITTFIRNPILIQYSAQVISEENANLEKQRVCKEYAPRYIQKIKDKQEELVLYFKNLGTKRRCINANQTKSK